MSSRSCRPIITLHVGNYANFVGSHVFNSQMNYFSSDSEVDRSVYWNQELFHQRQRIWTPRVLMVDLDCNWPRRSPTSEELETTEIGWDGDVNRISTEEKDTKLQKLDHRSKDSSIVSTRVEPKRWSDYLEWKLDGKEKVCYPISSFGYNSSKGVLSNYEHGGEIYSQLGESIEDGIRRYAEDCDYLEGFQILFDQDDGFGGLTAGILAHISDEYARKCRLGIGLSPPTKSLWFNETANDFKTRLRNLALAWRACSEYTTVFTSLNLSNDFFSPSPQSRKLPFINYKENSAYESSAILATALDTLTLPFFSETHPTSLSELSGLLNYYNRTMATVGLAFPLNLGPKTSLYGALLEGGVNIFENLCPKSTGSLPMDPMTAIRNYFVIRGVPNEKVMRQNEQSPGLCIPTSGTCLDIFSRESYSTSATNIVRTVDNPFQMSTPFPVQLVQDTVLATYPKTKFQQKDCWKLDVLVGAHNSTFPGFILEGLVSQVGQLRELVPHYSLELDDYAQCIEDLKTLRGAYEK